MSYDEPVDMTDDLQAYGFHAATREKHRALILISGPHEADVMRVALQWATELAAPTGAPVAVIDCEHRRAAAYADDYTFWHHCWDGAFDPVKLTAQAERAAQAIGVNGVLIIDSLTPFWSGKGGIQDIVDASAQAWKVGGPAHRDMMDALTRLPCHTICTVRAKSEWVIEELERDGLRIHAARPVAVQVDQRNGLEFDFEVVVRVDSDQYLTVTTTGPTMIAGTYPKPEGAGAAYGEWLGVGVERIDMTARAKIAELINAFTDTDDRTDLKQQFIRTFGLLSALTVDRVDEVYGWVADRLNAWREGVDIRNLPEGWKFGDTVAEPEAPAGEADAVESTPSPEATTTASPDEPDPVVDEGDGLVGKTKQDLWAICDTFGIEIDRRWGEAKLVDLIRQAMREVEAEQAGQQLDHTS